MSKENTSSTNRTAAGDVENIAAEAGNNSNTDGDSNEWYSTNAGNGTGNDITARNATNAGNGNATNDVSRTSARDTTIVNGVDDPTATNKDSRFIFFHK